jgi:hypothetical protein
MKKSQKLLIPIFILVSLILGFIAGIIVDYPKDDNTGLSGTIGKMDNYRNVKITEKDIQLRNDLLNNASFLKGYIQYYSAQYSICVKQCDDIDFAVKAADNTAPYKALFSKVIEDLKQYRLTLEQSREDILLALTSLKDLVKSDENNIAQILNVANVSIAQNKYGENSLFLFVESVEKFVQGNNPSLYTDLIKAHDLFSVTQLTIAIISNDKPMLKAYDKKQLFSSNQELKCFLSQEKLNGIIESDFNDLKSKFSNNEQLKKVIEDAAQIGNIEKKIGVIIPAFENLRSMIVASADKLGVYVTTEKLGGIVFNSEKLSAILNAEKLGLDNSEILRAADLEKLRAFNVEKLGTY